MRDMYNILIADDESYQRLGMKKILSELRPEYNIYNAKDGQEALTILKDQDIDIAFIDVRMPHIDGLDLIEKFNQLHKNTKFIIVSAYNDFLYAQTALRIGAFEYILKPIQVETISSLMKKVESDIENERSKMAEQHLLQNQLTSILPVYTGHLLNRWIMDNGNMSNYVSEQLLNKRFGLVILVDIVQTETYGKSSNDDLMNDIVIFLGNHFRTNDLNVVVFKIESESTRIAIVISSDIQKKLESKLLTDRANEVLIDIKNKGNFLCALGIGEVVDNINVNAKFSYRQAQTVLRYLFYTGYPVVLFHYKVMQKDVAFLDRKQKDLLTYAVREFDIEKVCKAIDNICIIATNDGFIRPQQFIYTINMWIIDILEIYRSVINLNDFEELHKKFNIPFIDVKTIVEYTDHIIQTLDVLIVYLKQTAENRYDEIVKDSIEYIKDNFNKDISLNDVAAHCYLSTSYFSKLFKFHTGATMSQYIFELRMERAKEMLGIPDIKIYEISNTIGYNDTKYFYRVFKKYFKMTPQEYKNKLRKLSH